MIYFEIDIKKNCFDDNIGYEEKNSISIRSKDFPNCIAKAKAILNVIGYDPSKDSVILFYRDSERLEVLNYYSNNSDGFNPFEF